MSTLDQHILELTDAVVGARYTLEQALPVIEEWLDRHGMDLTADDHALFRQSLQRESTDDARSLVDSVLRMHALRLLSRSERTRIPRPSADPQLDHGGPYAQARDAFNDALRDSEDELREARMDVAIANTLHLLGNAQGSLTWLEQALERLHPLATMDLVELAQAIPAMTLPKLGVLRRLGLRAMGLNLEALSERNRSSFVRLAQLQTNQVILLAHLLGVSFQGLQEHQRAGRAFRVVAHLVLRYQGMPGEDAQAVLEIADAIRRSEPEAAMLLAQQAYAWYEARGDTEGMARAQNYIPA